MINLLKSLIVLLYGIAGGFLGAWAGAHGTSLMWRREGIPTILTLLAMIVTKNPFTIVIMSMWGAFSMGYGIPTQWDTGSTLGRFWYKILNGNHFLTDVFTRGTVGLMICISLLVIPIIKKNWGTYGLVCLGIILVQSCISWRWFGKYIFLGKELAWTETIVYFVIAGLSAVLIVK